MLVVLCNPPSPLLRQQDILLYHNTLDRAFFWQVLDLGFNLLRTLPDQAFKDITSLTLLALDGNPMAR